MRTEISRGIATARVFPVLFMSLMVAVIGLFAGSFVDPRWIAPLAIVEVGMIFFAAFARRRRSVSVWFVYAFTFLSGMTLSPVVATYAATIGTDTVIKALAVTTFAYGGAALYAIRTKADFNFLGGFLFIGLLVLLAMGVMSIFLPFSSTAELVYSLLGIGVFIGYTLFDVSRLTRYGIAQQDVPYIVLSLYLDFVNLFLFVLRFFGLNVRGRN